MVGMHWKALEALSKCYLRSSKLRARAYARIRDEGFPLPDDL